MVKRLVLATAPTKWEAQSITGDTDFEPVGDGARKVLRLVGFRKWEEVRAAIERACASDDCSALVVGYHEHGWHPVTGLGMDKSWHIAEYDGSDLGCPCCRAVPAGTSDQTGPYCLFKRPPCAQAFDSLYDLVRNRAPAWRRERERFPVAWSIYQAAMPLFLQVELFVASADVSRLVDTIKAVKRQPSGNWLEGNQDPEDVCEELLAAVESGNDAPALRRRLLAKIDSILQAVKPKGLQAQD